MISSRLQIAKTYSTSTKTNPHILTKLYKVGQDFYSIETSKDSEIRKDGQVISKNKYDTTNIERGGGWRKL